MVVDVPERLHVPTISAPPAPIPRWNEFGDSWLVPVFDFASAYLHDRGALLVMYPSSSSHRGQLLGCYASCEHYRQYHRLVVLFFLVFSKFLLDISSSRVKRWQTRFILS